AGQARSSRRTSPTSSSPSPSSKRVSGYSGASSRCCRRRNLRWAVDALEHAVAGVVANHGEEAVRISHGDLLAVGCEFVFENAVSGFGKHREREGLVLAAQLQDALAGVGAGRLEIVLAEDPKLRRLRGA